MALSRDEWTEAALDALVEGGLKAVAVEPVARRLGTTKGSFYWHFADRQDLLSAVLALWEDQETTQAVAALAAISDPMAQLVALGRRAYARASRRGAHAVLLADAEDPRVAPTMARVTRTRLGVLERLYQCLGLDTESARRYARLAYAVYLGTAALQRAEPDDHADADELDRRVQLFVASVIPDTAHAVHQS